VKQKDATIEFLQRQLAARHESLDIALKNLNERITIGQQEISDSPKTNNAHWDELDLISD
jgi:hypothetical protein